MPIATIRASEALRAKLIRPASQEVLLADLRGTDQELDLSEPTNAGGLGRIRHFHRETSEGWPPNPLPVDPARAALGCAPSDSLRAQVFQLAGCNWRCWYCYVPFKLLSGKEANGEWIDADRLLDRYLDQTDPPRVIDLSGGQPDLVPEWTLWVIQELQRRGLGDDVYVWSDDNLSTDYLWRYLTSAERSSLSKTPMHGRVACFKGFDAGSFAFTTGASEGDFEEQFSLFQRLMLEGFDLYAYATFTGPESPDLGRAMRSFVDRLQRVDELLPLRTIPLEIRSFTPVHARLNPERSISMETQRLASELWQEEVELRFPEAMRRTPIHEIKLGLA